MTKARKATGGLPPGIRKRGSTYTVQVYGGLTPDGRKRWISRTAPTLAAAKNVRRELVDDVASGKYDADHVDAVATVGELLDAWLATADHEASTRYQTERMVERHVRPAFGNTPVDRVRPADIDRWTARLAKSGGVDGGELSGATVRRVFNVLRAALQLAVRYEWLDRNPCDRAKTPRADAPDPKPPTAADVRTLLTKSTPTMKANPQLALFIRLAAVTGARRGELLALRRSSFDGVSVAIAGAVGTRKDGAYLKATKTRTRHRVALDPATAAALTAHVEAQDATAYALNFGLDPDPFVFTAEADASAPLYPTTVSHWFRDHAKACKVATDLRSLRHFAATSLLSAGVDVKTVSGRLGHARTSTTTEHYAAWVPAADAGAADALGGLLDEEDDEAA